MAILSWWARCDLRVRLGRRSISPADFNTRLAIPNCGGIRKRIPYTDGFGDVRVRRCLSGVEQRSAKPKTLLRNQQLFNFADLETAGGGHLFQLYWRKSNFVDP